MVTNVILSIHPEYAKKIEDGHKIYEIRTRKINLEKGSIIWIRSSSPNTSLAILRTAGFI